MGQPSFTHHWLTPRRGDRRGTRGAIIAAATALWLLLCTGAWAEPFPQYDIIQPNVTFWTKIYSHYTTRQAVVHDSRDLSIIYDVIDLRPLKSHGARKINRKRMKQARVRYAALLRQLAKNPDSRNDACQRIAALFGSRSSKAVYARAARQVRCQIGQKDRFRAGLIRSGAYIDTIRTIFQSYGLPQTLGYLPHVESSFNINAYSKFGAAGMWQFTRSTGRRYMKVGYVLDERRDPIRATHAAAQLLRDNYNKLGSWPLAITAYNHGAAGMARAKRSHGSYPSIVKSYRSRTFKFASRNFYSEFLAAVHVASHYHDYFGDITFDRPRPSQTVPLNAYMDLDTACSLFNVSRDTIKSLNPALRDPVFQGQKYMPKGYTLRLPQSADISAKIPLQAYHQKQKPSYFYTVRRGDTAGRIARRHGVRLTDLIVANNLNRRATIYPKQTLRIPQKRGAQPKVKTAPITVASRSTAPPGPSKPQSATKAEKPKPEASYPEPVLATVIPLSVPDTIKDLAQSMMSTEVTLPSNEIVTVDVGFAKTGRYRGIHTGLVSVEVEETLGHYADWAHVRTQRIRNLNGLRFGSPLRLHQKVYVPLTEVTPEAFKEQRYEYHKRLQEDFFASYTVAATKPYRVKRGDSFWTLCRQKFEIPMWLLSNYNPEVDFADLRVHQRIEIPSVELKLSSDDAPLHSQDHSAEIWGR